MTNLNISTPSDLEILMTRVFDAPRVLVFEALSKPKLIQRWLSGPPGCSMILCEDDLRVGGKFRWDWRDSDGNEMSMTGVYREVVPPERIVRTESFEFGCDAQAGEQLATLVLTEHEEKTTLTVTLVYQSKEARDAALASGMEHGVDASYNQLAELLANQSTQLAAG